MEDGTTIAFFSYDLVSKFGFGDGDMLWDLIEERDLGVDHHDLLIAVVERLLVPRLDEEVETYTIGATLHNPIRARTVDGEEAGASSVFTPESVGIAVDDILAIAAELPRVEPDPDEWA